ncbi:MAG: MBL fold metallo-hydrolase [Chlorobi bacterium]|nr:MBL fold metallo-hydrolase [Chlorobiota bacterium]
MYIHTLSFNPWQVNTYIISDQTGECIIIDPGCFGKDEEKKLSDFLSSGNLKPVRLIHTHLHLDHVFGTKYVSEKYNLKPECHPDDEFFIPITKDYASQYGITLNDNPPPPGKYLNDKDEVKFGKSSLSVIHLPGHSPGGIAFYSDKDKILVSGDVLFRDSIGRSDLPGGDYDSLIINIKEKLMALPPETVVYPGHGPATTIEYERFNNPFIR